MKRYSNDGDRPISGETSTTRLYEEDLVEVKSLCVDGKTKSDVIRELVRRALYAKRYRQATSDPAFREILRQFDDAVGLRIHELEMRLRESAGADFETLITTLGNLYVSTEFVSSELKGARLALTPEEVTEEEFEKGWGERWAALKRVSIEYLNGVLGRRKARLDALDQTEDGS